MKKLHAKLLFAFSVLLLFFALPLPVLAAWDVQPTEVPSPQTFAQYASESSYRLEDCVDLDALAAYLLEHTAACETQIDISHFDIPSEGDMAAQLKNYIWYAMPEAFHVYGLAIAEGSERLVSVRLAYHDFSDTAQEYETCHRAFMTGANSLLAGIEGNAALTDVEKALLLHDRLAVWTAYDEEEQTEAIYTAYGALGKQLAVCQGYSMAYMYLLQRVGIASEYCTSKNLNHGWNIVYINGQGYHVDVTWDDPPVDISGRVLHKNFLRSTQGILQTGHTHAFGNDFNTTPSDTTYDDFYWQASETAFQLIADRLYYLDNEAEEVKKLTAEGVETVYSAKDLWPTGSNGYHPNQARLSSLGDQLLFSLADAVYRLDTQTNRAVKIFAPDLSVGTNYRIYGFKYEDGNLVCDLSNRPRFSATTKNYRVTQPYRTYTATFMDWDDTVLSRQTHDFGDLLEAPAVSARPGYVWDGWYDGLTKWDFSADTVTDDVVFTSKWYKTGWHLLEGTWYYYVQDVAQTGWLRLGDTWYYLKPSGAMATGWLRLGDTWYYLKPSGAMATGWLRLGDTWYYLNPSGAMTTGWLQYGNAWYYLRPSGAMAVGTVNIEGKLYCFDSAGNWVS